MSNQIREASNSVKLEANKPGINTDTGKRLYATNSSSCKPQFQPRRNFLYDKITNEPYAEWIGNKAVCLETGEVLFESKKGHGEFENGGFQRGNVKFDFSPPAHMHPKDPSISSQDLIDKGILTLEDFRVGKAGLSVEAFNKYMQQIGVMPK